MVRRILAYAIPFEDTVDIYGNEEIHTCTCGDYFYVTISTDPYNAKVDVKHLLRSHRRYKDYELGIFRLSKHYRSDGSCKGCGGKGFSTNHPIPPIPTNNAARTCGPPGLEHESTDCSDERSDDERRLQSPLSPVYSRDPFGCGDNYIPLLEDYDDDAITRWGEEEDLLNVLLDGNDLSDRNDLSDHRNDLSVDGNDLSVDSSECEGDSLPYNRKTRDELDCELDIIRRTNEFDREYTTYIKENAHSYGF